MPELFDYQRTGARWLAGRDAATNRTGLLGDEMGLGKTPTAIGAVDLADTGRVTVIAPAIMVDEWQAAFLAFGDVPREVHAAGSARRGSRVPEALCVSYERACQPAVAAELSARGGTLVVDESHYLKEPDSKRTRTIFEGLAPKFSGLYALSGTPTPNHAGELYPILKHSRLFRGTYGQFLGQYCMTRETEYGFQVLGHKNVEQLRAMLATLMLRRRQQVALPPTERQDFRFGLSACDLKSEAYAEFRRLEPRAATRIASLAASGNARGLDSEEVATMRRLIGVLKAKPVAERAAAILDADPTDKVVIFCLHTAPIEVLAHALGQYGVVHFTGDTPAKLRKPNVDAFQADPRKRVALCQMKAAGVGITLTSANHLIVAERPWSPADEEQAVRRIIRIGQKRPTFIHYATLTGSIDEAVNGVLQRKARLIDEIIN